MSMIITQKIPEEKVNNRCIELNCSLLKPFIYIKSINTKLHLKCLNDENEWYTTYNSFINNDKPPDH